MRTSYPYTRFEAFQLGWADQNLPLEYMFELRKPGQAPRMIRDWSVVNMAEVILLSRVSGSATIVGYARNSLGAISSTEPVTVNVNGPANYLGREMVMLGDYEEGQMNLDNYRPDRLVELVEVCWKAVLKLGTNAQLQLVSEVAYDALSGEPVSRPVNCTTPGDCGPWGSCPEPELVSVPDGAGGTNQVSQQNYSQCVCAEGYFGERCERNPKEIATQIAVTQAINAKMASMLVGPEKLRVEETLGKTCK